MGDFKKFYNTYLRPEDPMDWIIVLTMIGACLGGIVLLAVSYFNQGQ